MAKKRRIKRIAKASKLPNSANVLAIIASVLFLLNAIVAICFKDWVVSMIKLALQENPSLSSLYPMLATLTTAALVSMGISYFAMAVLVFCVNKMVMKTADRGWMPRPRPNAPRHAGG